MARGLIKELRRAEQPPLPWLRYAGFGGGALAVGIIIWLAISGGNTPQIAPLTENNLGTSTQRDSANNFKSDPIVQKENAGPIGQNADGIEADSSGNITETPPRTTNDSIKINSNKFSKADQIVEGGMGACNDIWCKFDCSFGKGRFDYKIDFVKDGKHFAIRDKKIDFSNARTENSYLRVRIFKIQWSKGIGTIRVNAKTHIGQIHGFKPGYVRGSDTKVIEILYFIDPEEKRENDAEVDIEFAPYALSGRHCRNTADFRIRQNFKFIPPKGKLAPKGTPPPDITAEVAVLEQTDVEKIKTLAPILENKTGDSDTRAKLAAACNAEYGKSIAISDLEQRKKALERFLNELNGCKLCSSDFMVKVNDELTDVNKTPEESLWSATDKNGGSVASYRKYIRVFPRGKYVKTANDKIAAIINKDKNAVDELNSDLINAGTDCALKVDAYDRYLKRTPVAHYTRMNAEANRQKKILVRQCGLVSLTGEPASTEGELRLTYFNKEIKDKKDITLKVVQNGKELKEGDGFLSAELPSAEPGQFEWMLIELEGGELVGRPKADSRWIDYETSEFFKENGRYRVMVVDFTNAKVGELSYPVLPSKGKDFTWLVSLIALLFLSFVSFNLFRFCKKIINWMRTKPALRDFFRL